MVMDMKLRQLLFLLLGAEVTITNAYKKEKIILKCGLYHIFIAAFNGAGKTRGASRGSGARHAPY